MRKIIIFLLFVSVFCITFVQQDPKAKDILNKVSSKIKSYTTIKADFIFTSDNPRGDIKNSSHGTIFLKNKKYKLILMENEIYFNGKTLWNYLIDVNEVNISEPDEEDESFFGDPANIFTFYEKDFKYKFIGEKTEDGKNLVEIDLFPINPEKNYFKITLIINKSEMQIYSIKYYGNDEGNYTIKIKKITPNIEMKDSMFIFNEEEHPGVEVIDLRW